MHKRGLNHRFMLFGMQESGLVQKRRFKPLFNSGLSRIYVIFTAENGATNANIISFSERKEAFINKLA